MDTRDRQERRRFARIHIDGEVRIGCGERHWQAELLDISLKGALFSRPADWSPEVNTACRVEVAPGAGALHITMEGKVMHVDGELVGFRCEHIDLDSMSHLKRLVELNLGDEAELERELGDLIGADGL